LGKKCAKAYYIVVEQSKVACKSWHYILLKLTFHPDLIWWKQLCTLVVPHISKSDATGTWGCIAYQSNRAENLPQNNIVSAKGCMSLSGKLMMMLVATAAAFWEVQTERNGGGGRGGKPPPTFQ